MLNCPRRPEQEFASQSGRKVREEGESVPGAGVLTCLMDKITGVLRGLLCVTPSCDSAHEKLPVKENHSNTKERGERKGDRGHRKTRWRKKVSKH